VTKKSAPESEVQIGRLTDAAAVASIDPLRVGMPSQDSIISVRPLRTQHAFAAAGSRAAPKYRIIQTNEVDAYEKAATSKETLKPAMAVAGTSAASDTFAGTARKAAKLSISNAPIKTFRDLKTLVNSLPPHEDMKNHNPPIQTTSTSNRVAEEQRNVRIKLFLYAASREADNDFHLILGRDPHKTPDIYMTMELSGLPTSRSASFPKLKAARDAFKAFFGADLPGATYDFYDPPIPVRIEGSLFWDASHSIGARPGPKSLKSRMPVIWEVHPITKIEFNP
jgi:hypothetical protein